MNVYERQALINEVWNRLYAGYGPQSWWPARTPYEMMAGAILTQNTAWKNVERAIEGLREALSSEITPEGVLSLPDDLLKSAIRPSGFFNQKTPRLKALFGWVLKAGLNYPELPDRTGALRKELLSISGVGKETCDSILLYALSLPVFVIDAYTRRLFSRLGLDVPADYDGFAEYFYKALPTDTALFNEYHALIVVHCKDTCLKNKPRCAGCLLADMCPAANPT